MVRGYGSPAMSELLGLDEIFAQMVLALGLALLIGNGLAWWKHGQGARPEGVEGDFRPGRVYFLVAVGALMTIWGAVSVFGQDTDDAAPAAGTEGVSTRPFEVLVFHRTEGFRHESIAAGIDAIEGMGEANGFSVTDTDDPSIFTLEGLQPYEVMVFLNTTGDVLDPNQEENLQYFVRSGKGFVGIHSAADTEYDSSWYETLIGSYFASHPEPQEATVEIVSPDHPVVQGIPASFSRFDEWYDFANLPWSTVTILAELDESSYAGGQMGDPHPIMWAHKYDGGRAFYTGFGHTPESFSEPLVLDLLTNAIVWAANAEPG